MAQLAVVVLALGLLAAPGAAEDRLAFVTVGRDGLQIALIDADGGASGG